jgi:putative ABC transport system permease protein
MRQFLIESMVLSLAGGIIGIIVGAGLAQIVSQFDLGGQRLPTLVSAESVALAVGVSVVVGVFFGLYPAARATRRHPHD